MLLHLQDTCSLTGGSYLFKYVVLVAWFSLTEGIENCWLVSSNDNEIMVKVRKRLQLFSYYVKFSSE